MLTIAALSGPVRYRIIGDPDAPWIVVCHGLGGDHAEFTPLAERLAGKWRVLLWDMPGHGASQPAPKRFSVAAIAESLRAVLLWEGVERPVFLGFSFGGIVAQALVRQGLPVRGLVAYGCFAPYLQPAPVPPWSKGLSVMMGFGLLPWARLKILFAERCALSPPGRSAVERTVEGLGRTGFLGMSRALLDAFDLDRDFRIPGPLMILKGAEDSNRALLDIGTQALLDVHPDATVVVVPQAGHAAHLDQPSAFESAVLDFLERF